MKFRLLPKVALAFIAMMGSFAFGSTILAEQPAPVIEAPAESKKAPAPPRAKPQVIYHVSKADVAALHAQAKSHPDALAVDGNMPMSLQMSRAAANEAAAKAAAEPSASPNAPAEKPDSIKPAPKHSRVLPKERARTKNSNAQKSHGPKSRKH